MGLRVDFTDVPDAGSLPVDEYTVKITEGEVRLGKESNKPYINWTLTVQDGKFAGRLIWTNTSLSPDALQYGYKPLMKALDLDTDGEFELEVEPDDDSTFPKNVTDDRVIGANVVVKLGPSKNDKDVNEVKRYKPVGAASSLLPG